MGVVSVPFVSLIERGNLSIRGAFAAFYIYFFPTLCFDDYSYLCCAGWMGMVATYYE